MNQALFFSLVLLVLIAVSDFSTRQIPVLFLIGELLLSVFIGYLVIGRSVLKIATINYLILGLQILILLVWTKFREGRSEITFWSRFGKGDLFMLVITAVNFSLFNYLIFLIIVCILSIIIYAGLFVLQKKSMKTIPLAGFLAIGMATFRILNISGIYFHCYSDILIKNLIHGIY